MSLSKKKKLNREINKSKLGEIYPGAVKGGLGGLRGSKSRPTGSQGIQGWAYRIPGDQGEAYRISGGQGVGLQGPRGSKGRPTGSQGVKG